MTRREELNDKQWEIVEPLIPKPCKRDDGKGRPRRDDRQILNGILLQLEGCLLSDQLTLVPWNTRLLPLLMFAHDGSFGWEESSF